MERFGQAAGGVAVEVEGDVFPKSFLMGFGGGFDVFNGFWRVFDDVLIFVSHILPNFNYFFLMSFF